MNVIGIIQAFYNRSVRVLTIAHRPRNDEYWTMAKTAGLGMALIGLIGFFITFVFGFI
ncbi:protein translocase SEC61 complex subunit gamma [Candidatus Micrarchaeota archaeon]|nr:protein translocase SEC61 complex subunit gamma [Candidatus Micrarchaeota archaeon]